MPREHELILLLSGRDGTASVDAVCGLGGCHGIDSQQAGNLQRADSPRFFLLRMHCDARLNGHDDVICH
jgi:hypothetical protein